MNTEETEHITKDMLKCSNCGFEKLENPSIDYNEQSRCSQCDYGRMMGWQWPGWKPNELREKQRKINALLAEVEEGLKVCQETDDIKNFTKDERTIGKGVMVVEKLGQKAPWLNGFGACLIKIYGIRRRGDLVEFGIGNEEPPILGWVKANDFFEEWPD